MTKIFYLLRYVTRPAYRVSGIGLGRVCEWIRRYAAKKCSRAPFLISDFRGNAKLKLYINEHMGGQIFFRGSYSGDQLDLLEKLLPVDGVFIDAGANQGEFSIAAARVAKLGKIISFEPAARYRDRLIANIDLNDFKNVKVMALALGDDEGSFTLYDREEEYTDGSRHEGLPTLFSSDSRSLVRETVLVRRLDSVISELNVTRVDVIKLDIEGAEWAALRGAEQALAQHRPTLIVEIGRETCQAAGYEPEEFACWIISQGYRLDKIVKGGRTQPIAPEQLEDFQNIVAWPLFEKV